MERITSEKVYKAGLEFLVFLKLWRLAIKPKEISRREQPLLPVPMEHGQLFWQQIWSHNANNQAPGPSYCRPGAGIIASCFSLLPIYNSLPLDVSSCHFQPPSPCSTLSSILPHAFGYDVSSVVLWLYSITTLPTTAQSLGVILIPNFPKKKF